MLASLKQILQLTAIFNLQHRGLDTIFGCMDVSTKKPHLKQENYQTVDILDSKGMVQEPYRWDIILIITCMECVFGP